MQKVRGSSTAGGHGEDSDGTAVLPGAQPVLSAPRFLPDQPLPPYAFVPGRRPHPLRSPGGHRMGGEDSPPIDPAAWRDSAAYLRGIDLFNHGYYWEAHEAWEAGWHAMHRTGPVADMLKALIRMAAAGVKLREPVEHAARSHARKGAALFRAIADDQGDDRFMGLSLRGLVSFADAVAAGTMGQVDDRDLDVAVVFSFLLWPSDAR